MKTLLIEHSTANRSIVFSTAGAVGRIDGFERAVDVAERAVDHRVADVAADRHLGELLLDEPELGDRPAELPPLFRVSRRVGRARSWRTDMLRAPSFTRPKLRMLKATLWPSPIVPRTFSTGTLHVVEHQRRRRRAVEAELLLVGPAHRRPCALDEERGELLAVDLREDR